MAKRPFDVIHDGQTNDRARRCFAQTVRRAEDRSNECRKSLTTASSGLVSNLVGSENFAVLLNLPKLLNRLGRERDSLHVESL